MKRIRIALAVFALAIPASVASAQQYFVAHMWGWEEVPPVNSPAIGSGYFTLDSSAHVLHYRVNFVGLASAQTGAYIHGPASSGQNGPVLFTLATGSPAIGSLSLDAAQEAHVLAGQTYVNVTTTGFPSGEIRGQISQTIVPAPTSFCFGDGSGTACPCGNASAPSAEEGCVSSFGTAGKLVASGLASVGADSFVLTGTGMANGTALYFQGTTRVNGGAGSVFGDGLLCVGGTVIPLATKTNASGSSVYPGPGDPPISARGLLPAGGVVTRQYQVWYRNVASFCQPEGFNLTNGVEAAWIP